MAHYTRFTITAAGIFLCTLLDFFTCFSLAAGLNCTGGFSSVNEIENGDRANLRTFPTVMLHFNLWVFPSIKFTCDVRVTGWIFQGEDTFGCLPDLRNQTLSLLEDGMPYIEIWRDLVGTTSQNDLKRVHLTNNLTIKDVDVSPIECGIGVYQIALNEPFDASAGDIVGIAVRSGQERIRMRFKENNVLSYRDPTIGLVGTSDFFNPDDSRVVNETRYTPLLTVLIEAAEGSTTMVFPTVSSTSTSVIRTPSMSLPKPTSTLPTTISIMAPPSTPLVTATSVVTPGVTTQREDTLPPPVGGTGANLNIIIGAVVAVLFVIVLVLIAVLIVLVVIRKHQNVEANCKPTDLDNPSYHLHTVSNVENKANTITPNGRDPIYDQPIASPVIHKRQNVEAIYLDNPNDHTEDEVMSKTNEASTGDMKMNAYGHTTYDYPGRTCTYEEVDVMESVQTSSSHYEVPSADYSYITSDEFVVTHTNEAYVTSTRDIEMNDNEAYGLVVES